MSDAREQRDRGEWYLADDELFADLRRCQRLNDRFNATRTDDDDERRRILEEMFGEVGADAEVLPPFRCSHGLVRLGERAFVNLGAFFMDDAVISIGDDVRLGANVALMTANHPMEDHDRRRAGWERALPITIGPNSWLGAGVIVCPGVTIGADAVVGAGSVVIRNVPDRTFVAGNPARFVRTL